MNSKFFHLLLLTFLLSLNNFKVLAIQILQPTNGNIQYVQAATGDKYYDSGGPINNYFECTNPNEDCTSTLTLCGQGILSVKFNSFLIATDSNQLIIKSGNSIIGNSGTDSLINGTFTSTDPSGCLTLIFQASTILNAPGWDADIVVNTPSQCSPDFETLKTLYRSTNGPSWTHTWDTTDCTVTNWYGVTKDTADRVIVLNLVVNGLTGSLPPEIGDFPNLQYLYLHTNSLIGSIPCQIGGLNSLKVILLGGNQLTGTIPAEFSELSNLIQLGLDNNKLTGTIPGQLGNLSNLTSLSIGINQLSGNIPIELGNLSNLHSLWLNDNQLSGTIPGELGNLTQLNSLSLYNNQLSSSIPGQIGNLSNLQLLFLDNNRLSGSIPSEFGNLSSLTFLRANDNQISGSIPAQLGSLANLKYLLLDNNQITGSIPSQLGNLSMLEVLNISFNRINGNIPVQLESLINLHYLYLRGNQLTGCFPAGLHNLCNHLNGYDLTENSGLLGGGDFASFCSNNIGVCIDCSALNILKPTFSNTQPTCFVPTGTITITNKSSQDSVSFNNGLTYQISNIKTGLTPGNYRVLIKSTMGCISPDSLVTIKPVQGIPATPLFSIIQPTCAVQSGKITITNKQAQDSVSFDNGLTFQKSNVKTGLLSNSYTVLIKNLAGCKSQSVFVIISTIPIMPSKPILSITQPSCINSTGSIVITNKGLSDSASFDNGLTYQLSNLKSSLMPGTYVMILKSISGCISNFTNAQINVVPVPPATPLFNITQPTCTNTKGSITIVNRLSADSVSFNNGLTYQRSNVKSGLAPGNYMILIKSLLHCFSGIVVATINAATIVPSIPNLIITQPSCLVPSGTLSITNKSALDSSSFNNGLTYQLSPILSELSPGTFITKIKSISGCISGSKNAVINAVPVIPSTPLLNVTQPTCTTPTGTIRITNKTGADSASFDNGLTYQISNSKSGLLPGNYNVLIKRSGSCFSTVVPVILSIPILPVSINNLDSSYYKFATAFRLNGIPANGFFMVDSAPLINNTLDPKKLSLGTHAVSYAVTKGICTSSLSKEVLINTYNLGGEGTQCYAIQDSINILLNAGSANGSSANNIIINQQTYLDSTYQKWIITDVNGFKHIQNKKSGLYLKALSNSSVVQGVLDSTADWFIIPNQTVTSFSLYNPARARYLTLNGSTGYTLSVASASGKPGANQKFNFVSVNCMQAVGPTPLVLTIPRDTTVYLIGNHCDTSVHCDLLISTLGNATAIGCNPNVTIKSVIIGKTDTGGASLVRRYGLGSTSVLVIAKDGCGNVVRDTLKITVKDTIKPCAKGYMFNAYFNDQGYVRLNAKKHENGSTDNCTPVSGLKYSWSKNVNDTILMVDCNTVKILHAGGDIFVDSVRILPFELPFNLFVTDGSGNQDTLIGNRFIAFFDTLDYCHKWYLINNPTSINKLDRVIKTNNHVSNILLNLSIFPNPNSGQFSVKFDHLDLSKSSELSIYSMPGQKIMTQKIITSDPVKINLEKGNASKGMYLLVLKNGDKMQMKKFVIQ